ncbi:hypothetical protein GIB67_014932 [Kingdonia uniflora]|uniref:Aminotransferase-like plant mobile domain-containing protein n=1 Tax=Kingdonia uniflora TaxID=39325 RepID=A0A7J7MTX1_9MAGN|nr:hypothetical protein GIB67_014932 [Kingdonia uniflora]
MTEPAMRRDLKPAKNIPNAMFPNALFIWQKMEIEFEEVANVSTEPPPPLLQYYGARDFRQLTQLDGKCHLSTSVATTSARVGFKCRSILAKLREICLTLIKVPHLKQRLKATNLMSVFDYKIRNGDNQVVLAMVERRWPTTHTFHLPCGELGITPRDFTVLTGIGIGTGDPMIFEDFYTEYGKALRIFPNMESKDYEKGCVSFAHLGTYLDHTRVNINDKANAKTIFRVFMLLYFGGNKAKHHLALMRQQLDLRTINNMQREPFRNMKDVLKREVIIAENISRKRVLLQCPFGGYEWYLGDRCWAQLEYSGWIEAQHYIVGHHVDNDAYWRYVSHGALMSDIARYGNIDIPSLGALTDRVTILHVEFPTTDFSTQETQIPPSQFGDYSGWIMEGFKLDGKMKRELLKRRLHVGGVHGGGVRGEGHLKVGPLLPDDQDVPGDLLFSVVWVLTGIVCLVLFSVV